MIFSVDKQFKAKYAGTILPGCILKMIPDAEFHTGSQYEDSSSNKIFELFDSYGEKRKDVHVTDEELALYCTNLPEAKGVNSIFNMGSPVIKPEGLQITPDKPTSQEDIKKMAERESEVLGRIFDLCGDDDLLNKLADAMVENTVANVTEVTSKSSKAAGRSAKKLEKLTYLKLAKELEKAASQLEG